MSRFIESICLENGILRNLDYHQKRLNQTRYKTLGLTDLLDLSHCISIPEQQKEGKYKCRILYAEKIESIEILPYSIRPVHSIRLIENNEIQYKYKRENRKIFDLLKDAVAEDEIILTQNGKVTDSSYSNLVFFNGKNWFTPTSYLLNGCMRQFLLDTKQIATAEINSENLHQFQSF
ncbi:MAG: aminotransferase class IV, partial [Weeksellaceae bacterium]|nr:aminotransferase class IV [Weeksellaceae bacterium]